MGRSPVKYLTTFRNFNGDERQVLGCAKYGLYFIDAAMLIHFVSAVGAFLQAKHIFEDTSRDQLRFVITLCLASVYCLIFLSFFASYCFVKDHIILMRTRVALLLSSGLVNGIFISLLCVFVSHFYGISALADRLAIDVAEEADVAWFTVLLLSAATVIVALIAGFMALCMNERIDKISNPFKLYSTYVNASPVSPYSTYWKPSRVTKSSPNHPRSQNRDLYPKHELVSHYQGLDTASPKHDAIIRELKGALPHRNGQQLTVL